MISLRSKVGSISFLKDWKETKKEKLLILATIHHRLMVMGESLNSIQDAISILCKNNASKNRSIHHLGTDITSSKQYRKYTDLIAW